MTILNKKPTFSGHDSFQCRHLWLKKGYDFVKKGKSFAAEDAVVELGVGKNMVTSIRHWLRAFNIVEGNDQVTDFADKLLADDGFDPYLEDEATLWLLHYHLVKKGYATTYYLIFNELRKERIEFTADQFNKFVQRKSETTMPFLFNANTIKSDFEVFQKLYVGSETQDKEDVIAGIMRELRLVKAMHKEGRKGLVFTIPDNEKTEIPEIVLLYALLDNPGFGLSVNFESLFSGYNTIGSIFAINRTGLLNKIESLAQNHVFLVFKDDAGIKELQFKEKPDALTILKDYYGQ